GWEWLALRGCRSHVLAARLLLPHMCAAQSSWPLFQSFLRVHNSRTRRQLSANRRRRFILSPEKIDGHQRAMNFPRLGEDMLERIGNTPLLRLRRVGSEYPRAQILGKAEWHNSGGSVKDRAAANIIT